jgi:MoxR-like ATPase
MVNTIAQALGCSLNAQFTPDLMPSDILGSEILDETPNSNLLKSCFSNIVLADEINHTHLKHRQPCWNVLYSSRPQ